MEDFVTCPDCQNVLCTIDEMDTGICGSCGKDVYGSEAEFLKDWENFGEIIDNET